MEGFFFGRSHVRRSDDVAGPNERMCGGRNVTEAAVEGAE